MKQKMNEQVFFQKNYYKDKIKRCFILGCGPSLLDYDLSLLKDEFVFGVNLIMNAGIVPDILCVGDQLMLHDNIDQIYREDMQPKYYVFRNILSHKNIFLRKLDNVRFMEGRPNSPLLHPNFLVFNETTNGVICDLVIPCAAYLGFQEVYLLGVDGTHGQNSHFYDYEGEETNNYKQSIVRGPKEPTSYIEIVNALSEIDVELFSCNLNEKVTPEINKKPWKEII